MSRFRLNSFFSAGLWWIPAILIMIASAVMMLQMKGMPEMFSETATKMNLLPDREMKTDREQTQETKREYGSQTGLDGAYSFDEFEGFNGFESFADAFADAGYAAFCERKAEDVSWLSGFGADSGVSLRAFKHSADQAGGGNASILDAGDVTTATEALLSPSEKFLIRYHISGMHAVHPADSNESGIPDFVEEAAAYADSSWNHLIGRLGFSDPVPEDGHYEIILEIRGSSIFGETVIVSGGQSTRTYVHPTFTGFPENSDPAGSRYGSLKVTIAHELKHASQYKGTGWQGDAGNIHWMELDAILAENLVFPDVKDYYRHLGSMNSIFRNPRISVPEYPWQVTWMMYWAERFGPEFMAGVWARLGEGQTMTGAIRTELQDAVPVGNGETGTGPVRPGWRYELTLNYLWHLASGPWAALDDGFADRSDYPAASPSIINNHLQRTISPQFTYMPLSAGFHKMVPAAADTGDIIIFAVAGDSLTGLGLYGFCEDGSGEKRAYTADQFGRILQNSGLRWENTDTLALVTVNAGDSGTRSVELLAGNGASIERLLYGDATLNGTLNSVDVGLILSSVAGNAVPLKGFSRFVSDVTGNGIVSAYDASLILRKLSGMEEPFPVDVNGNGFGPEFELIASGAGSPFAGLRGNSGENLSGLHFRLEADETAEQLETGIVISVENAGDDGFYSVLIELLIPAEYLEVLSDIQLTGSLFGGMASMHISGDTVRVAMASVELVSSGAIAVIPVYALLEGKPELVIQSVKVDEFTARNISVEGIDLLINQRPAVGIDPGDELPRSLALHQNYPNPFNPATMLRFDLPESGVITLKLYDITGRLAGTVAAGYKEAGRYELPLNSEQMGLSSGTYLLVLEINGKTDVIKLSLVK